MDREYYYLRIYVRRTATVCKEGPFSTREERDRNREQDEIDNFESCYSWYSFSAKKGSKIEWDL